LIADGIDPMAIRLSLLNRQFNEDTMWTHDKFHAATEQIDFWRLGLSRTEAPETDLVIEAMINALSQNLDSIAAIKEIDNWCRTEGTGGNPGELSRAIDALLGIAL
jgi:L-cysteine:1D-myo-inositol 2-amino-2-deoxy-alpha-D-glucopyranoside ligase